MFTDGTVLLAQTEEELQHNVGEFMLHSSECCIAIEERRTSLDIGTTEAVHTCCVQLTMAHSMQLHVNVEQYALSKTVALMCAAPSLVLKLASSVYDSKVPPDSKGTWSAHVDRTVKEDQQRLRRCFRRVKDTSMTTTTGFTQHRKPSFD